MNDKTIIIGFVAATAVVSVLSLILAGSIQGCGGDESEHQTVPTWTAKPGRSAGRRTLSAGGGDDSRAKADSQITTYSRTLEGDPKNVPALIGRGEAWASREIYDRALADLDKAVELSAGKSGHAAALRARGQVLLAQGKPGAMEDLNKAVELDGGTAASHLARGMAYFNQRKPAEAIRDFDWALRLEPGTVNALFYRGLASELVRDHKRAVADYTEVIRLQPNHAAAMAARGRARLAMGDYGPAIADCDAAEKLNPKDPAVYLTRGSARARSGNREQAVRDYDKAVELDPDSASAWRHRGQLNALIGRHEQAVRDFTRVLEREPRNAGVLLERARSNLELKNVRDASADLSAVLQLDDKCAEALGLRGRIMLRSGNAAQAVDDLERAANARLGDADVLRDLAEALILAGRYDKAEQVARGAMDRLRLEDPQKAVLAALRLAAVTMDGRDNRPECDALRELTRRGARATQWDCDPMLKVLDQRAKTASVRQNASRAKSAIMALRSPLP